MVLLILIDAFIIEPSQLTVTRVAFPLRAVPPGKELRIMHLTDLHITSKARVHRKLVDMVAAESPALILITGDLLQNPGRGGQPQVARELFDQLSQVAPVVMVLGNHEKMPPETSIRWVLLRNEAANIEVRGVPLRLIGWEQPYHLWNQDTWRPPRLGTDPQRVNILLVHSPDWFEEAAAQGMDLALAGHTHGGQVRLPLWGAIFIPCATGKRFEYGPYHLSHTHAFVSRGVGQNPLPSPPARFLCPPEVAVITLRHGE
ncbi:MAG: metallophosphoesterase [Armatimonadota bacterium]